MAGKSKLETPNFHVLARNKRARFDYHISETFEVGIILTGSEVKSCRNGKVSINESYASVENEAIWLINANITEYPGANRFNHEPTRPRKLLLHKKQIKKLAGLVQKKGVTLVPISMYFNHKGIIKIELGLATGKAQHDKRHVQKERDWSRDKQRLMKDN